MKATTTTTANLVYVFKPSEKPGAYVYTLYDPNEEQVRPKYPTK